MRRHREEQSQWCVRWGCGERVREASKDAENDNWQRDDRPGGKKRAPERQETETVYMSDDVCSDAQMEIVHGGGQAGRVNIHQNGYTASIFFILHFYFCDGDNID